MQGKPHKPIFCLHLSWWDFTRLIRWKMSPEFLWNIFSPNSIQWLQNTLKSSWIHNNRSEIFPPHITTPTDLYYTINHPCQRGAAHAEAERFATLDIVPLLFALSSISEPTVSPTASPQLLHKPSSFTQTGRLLIKEKAEQWKVY